MSGHERFQRVDELFRDAMRLDACEREAYLDDQCGGDVSLRADVDALLAEDYAACGPLDRPALGAAVDLHALAADAVDDVPLPARIGTYRIISLLGAGGMGAVYEAEQDQPRRRVALKVIRAEVISRKMLRRFRQEAQVLAQLTHPGIAQIYAAGTADDGEGGTPYFAMELVVGEPLLTHAEHQCLGVRGRLELMAEVADAVHYAHTRGVIHRDLKPANILVDQTAQPKILDFGVARATDADVQAATMQTEAGQIVGTVAYMSPEQAVGDPAAVDMRSDVYSLGVIAYELLAGQPPHGSRGRLLHEALRAIREDEPTRLSSVNRALRGDVETIISKALEKDAQNRYQSAAELAADIRRHLRDETIIARPASTIYQLRKFARRNRAIVAGATLAFLTMIAATLVSTWQARVALRARDLADRQTTAAIEHAARATVASAMVAIEHGDPQTARRLLDDAPSDLRNWEWRHVATRLDNCIAMLEADAPVLAASFSNGGERIVTVTQAGIVELWDPFAPEQRISARLGETPRRAAMTADGEKVVASFHAKSEDGRTIPRSSMLGLWDTSSGRELARFGPVDDELLALAVTADGQCVAAGGRRGAMLWFPFARGAAPPTITIPDMLNSQAIAFSKDGGRVAIAFNARTADIRDGWLATFDARTGKRLKRSVRYSIFPVRSVDLDSRGTRLAAGQSDKKLIVHDVDANALVRGFTGHQKAISCVALDGQDRLLAAASEDSTIRVWEIDSGEALEVFAGLTSGAEHIAFSPDGQRVLGVAGASVRVWSVNPDDALRVMRGHTSYVYGVAFVDDERIVSASWDGTLRVWNPRTREELSQWRPEAGIAYGVAHSAGGGSAGSGLIATAHGDGSVHLWDARTYAHYRTLHGDKMRMTSVSLSADGSRVAARSEREVIVWDTVRGDELARWSVPVKHRDCKVVLSPDGRTIAADASRGEILLCEVDGARELRRLSAKGQVVCALAFNRDGTRLVSGSRGADTTARLWDVRNGREIQRFVGHADNVYAVALSHDETRIATGSNDTTVRLWDTDNGQQVAQLDGHLDYVYNLAFSPDGSILASGSGDATVRIWDTRPVYERWRQRRQAAPPLQGQASR